MMEQSMLDQMIILATRLHKGQVDRAGQPYILHPLRVMLNLSVKTDEELNCIAVGHDLIEDTSATEDYLRTFFTKRIVDGILALTKQEGQSYEEYQQTVMSNRDAIIVKYSDLKDNVNLNRLTDAGLEITSNDIRRQQKYLDFIRKLDTAFRQFQK